MATEDQKKARLKRLANDVMFGVAKEFYKMLGKAVLASSALIGQDILEEMEGDLGLEVQGEDPESLLIEIERILVDEFGLAETMEVKISDNIVEVDAVDCFYGKCTDDLRKENIPPYFCVPMMISAAALRKRLGLREHFKEIKREGNRCQIFFEMVD